MTSKFFKTVVKLFVTLTLFLNFTIGKAVQNILAERCSNSNGSGLLGFVRNGMEFKIGDYDFRETMAQKIRENTNGGHRCALRPS
jgi:hypothetical protein